MDSFYLHDYFPGLWERYTLDQRAKVSTGNCVTIENMPAHRALSVVLFCGICPLGLTEHTVTGISRDPWQSVL